MGAQSARQPSKHSPPRKRRRLMSRPGKVMKPAYFKGIQWTKVFVTGPLDPVHNEYKFYCQICKTNVSIFSKGHVRSFDTIRPRVILEGTSVGDTSTRASSTKSQAPLSTLLEERTDTYCPPSSFKRRSHCLSLHPLLTSTRVIPSTMSTWQVRAD